MSVCRHTTILTLRRTLIFLTFFLETFAAIGPVTNLRISNAIIAPDGFSRSWVIQTRVIFRWLLLQCCSRGRHLSRTTNYWQEGHLCLHARFEILTDFPNQGDHFQINVIDRLTDNTMLRSTSIVIHPCANTRLLFLTVFCFTLALAWYFPERNQRNGWRYGSTLAFTFPVILTTV